MLVTALAAGRGIMLPAMAQAGMKVAAFSTGAYGRVREQFNLPLSRFEGIQEVAARIAGEAYKMDAARRLTLAAIDAGEKPAVVSGIMKYQATERLRRTINDAMDVHAGKAVIDGPKNYLASTYRAIPIAITVEGANIMTRSLMIYGQGSIRCHPFLQKEIEAANNPDRTEAVRQFDVLLGRHAAYVFKLLALAVGRAWTAGRLAASPVDGPTARHFRQLKRLSAALALVSEAAIVTLGGALKRKEMISARLGDALSELYIVSAMLKQFDDRDCPADELPLLDYACRSSLNAAEEALKGVIVNFPVRPVGWFLKLAVQPFGVLCKVPRDRQAQIVSDIISEPGAARDRLMAGIYVGPETELGRLDRAFRLMAELEPLKAKMRKARLRGAEEAEAAGILNDNEAARMGEALELVREVLEVDRFAGEELTGKTAPAQAAASGVEHGQSPPAQGIRAAGLHRGRRPHAFIKARDAPGPFTPVDLAVEAGRPLLARQPFEGTEFDEVILGCVNAHPDEVNPGRIAGLAAGARQRRARLDGAAQLRLGAAGARFRLPGHRRGPRRPHPGRRHRGAFACAAAVLDRGRGVVRRHVFGEIGAAAPGGDRTLPAGLPEARAWRSCAASPIRWSSSTWARRRKSWRTASG
jgi:hypothetical protein